MRLPLLALVSVAVASPLVVYADEGNVSLSGQLRGSVDNTDNGDESQTNVSNGSSRITFQGTEPLGNGLNAVFQIESQFALDDGGGDSLFDGARDSFVGLDGGFGTVVVGIFDTPYKDLDAWELWGDSMGDHNTIIGNTGDDETFSEREGNSVGYNSPDFGGFTFEFQYAVDEDEDVDMDIYSAALAYENGPLFAGIAYEVHGEEAEVLDITGAVIDTEDTEAFKGGIVYTFGEATQIGAVYETIESDGPASAFDRDAYYISFAQGFGNNTFKAAYGRAEENDLIDDSGADFFVVGVSHALSKRTEIYGLYAMTDNDDSGVYGIGRSTSGATSPAAAGAELDTISIGVNHKF